MLFNSLEFILFFIVFFLLYWKVFANYLKAQNLLILIGSLFFYGWWDWRFLFLIFLSAGIDFIAGININHQHEKRAKFWLFVSIVSNLAILGFFKYYNFFVQSIIDAFAMLNIKLHIHTLQIILPVGISFYTFQSMSYTIDVYRNKLVACKNPIDFFAFVTFFPQLVAGPIERATHLIPQIQNKRTFDYKIAIDGLKQTFYGLCKKIIIADTCAEQVNYIFVNYQNIDSSFTLALGVVLFAFQIYGDFSGYSDMAIGLSKMLGIDIMTNFNYPYFSRNVAEFWRRWHISLSTWFRDYLYIPLGGSKFGLSTTIRNTFIIFLVSGFWHGANFTFLAWGFLHALFFVPILIQQKTKLYNNTVAQNSSIPSLLEFWQMIFTFILVCFAWIFFRSATIADAFHYIQLLFRPSIINIEFKYIKVILLIFIFILIEWNSRHRQHGLQLSIQHKFWRYLIYYVYFIALCFFISKTQKTDFIYFAF